MPDYQKGKIYTIRCRDDDTLIYVGSTIQPLSVRWGGHKRDCKYLDNPDTSIVKLMKNKGTEKFYIELYENFPCNSKEELHRREGQVQRQIGTVNKVIAGRTNKEWYIDNKEKMVAYKKEYYEKNQEKILEKKKEYRENNKERMAERDKIYRENNKERVLEKITCNHCGVLISRGNLERHKRTPKCFNVVPPVTLDNDDASV